MVHKAGYIDLDIELNQRIKKMGHRSLLFIPLKKEEKKKIKYGRSSKTD